ncbi:MAG: CapA family protein [Clostridia bacterium]
MKRGLLFGICLCCWMSWSTLAHAEVVIVDSSAFTDVSGGETQDTASPQTTLPPAEVPSGWPRTITITVGGDCTLGCTDAQAKRSVGFRSVVEKEGYAWPFSGIVDFLSQDDMTLVNLEGTLTESNQRVEKTFNFKGPAAYGEILTAGSVEAVNLANNHFIDYGEQGKEDTKAALDAHGVTHAGNGDLGVYEIKGVKIGMTGYSFPFSKGKKDIRADVEQLREMGCQIVIASFHWGSEYEPNFSRDQRTIGRAAIDAGADVVVGHHPHIVQGIEKYKGRYILYSLGNLVFGGNTDPDDRDTYLGRLTFTVDETASVPPTLEIYPVRLTSLSSGTDYRPVPAEGKAAERIQTRIRERSSNLDE